MGPVYECPEKFSSLTMHMVNFPKFLKGFPSDLFYEYANKI